MEIPASVLANLGALGVLEISEDVRLSFEEGFSYGSKDQATFFQRLLKREFSILEGMGFNKRVDDEYIRGYRQCLESIETKYSVKLQK